MDGNSIKPYLVINLGVEMLFVIQQRLRAQEINAEKAIIVMNDIGQALFSTQMTSNMFKNEDDILCTHKGMKSFLEYIVHSSIMQLDRHSMDRLFDLITMIFKWQTTISCDIIAITKKHLFEAKSLYTTDHLLQLIENTENEFENHLKRLDVCDLASINHKLLIWLSIFKVRVSILLKLGLQNQDGSFIITEHRNAENDDQIVNALLANIGANIYALTQDRKTTELSYEKKEISSLVNQIQSGSKVEDNFINIKLTTSHTNLDNQDSDQCDNMKKSSQSSFNYIDLKCASTNHSLSQIFEDMSFDTEINNV